MNETDTVFCQNCGKKIPASAVFCPFCGAKQERTEVYQPTESQTQNSSTPESTAPAATQETPEPAATVAAQPLQAPAAPVKKDFDQAAFDAQPKSTFQGAISRYFHNLFNTSGRTSVADFWWVQLFIMLIVAVITIIGSVAFIAPLFSHYALYDDYSYSYASGFLWRIFGFLGFLFVISIILFLLNFSAMVRRLHDSDKPGTLMFLWLLYFVPYLGPLAAHVTMLVLTVLPGSRYTNLYGEPTRTTTAKVEEKE